MNGRDKTETSASRDRNEMLTIFDKMRHRYISRSFRDRDLDHNFD